VTSIPDVRIRICNSETLRDGEFVLYWMIACRRLRWNFALERAADEARRLKKPLVILEPLRCGYRWANDRIHRFVIEGMADHGARLARSAENAEADEVE
jgi:deoxyribodipyrimidine photo-lyase